MADEQDEQEHDGDDGLDWPFDVEAADAESDDDFEPDPEPTPEEIREASICLAALGATSDTDICCFGITESWRRAQRFNEKAKAITYAGIMAEAQEYGLRVIADGDDEWPTSLDDLQTHDPLALALWVAGQPLDLREAVCVTGSRAATRSGVEVAHQMGHDLASNGHTVIATLSHGIDVAALRGALTADGPAPVVVLAEGIHDTVPPRLAHEESLVRSVMTRCTVVTEHAPNVLPSRSTHEDRARILATLGVATVVVEGSTRSSAQLTARWARDRHRLVFAVPGPVSSVASALPHDLIATGRAQLVTSARDVMEAIASTVITDSNAVATEGDPS